MMITETRDQTLEARHDDLVARLAQHADNPEIDAGQRELAQAWRNRLESVRARAIAPLTIAFMAKVGCGKTTLLAAATGLRLEGVGSNPKRWSVLPVGDGRTTLSDTRLEFAEREDIALEVTPLGAKALKTELRLFAEDHWHTLRSGKGVTSGQNPGEELHRLLRRWLAPDSEQPRVVLKELAEAAADGEAFHDALRSRIDFEARTRTLERCYTTDDSGLVSLKADLKALMRGELEGAPAPQQVRLVLPRLMAEFGDTLARLVDTQGIDSDAPASSIRGRSDLQEHLFEDDALIVVCSEFASAPDVVSRELIAALTRDELQRKQAFRLLLVHRCDPDARTDERKDELRLREERLAECRDKLRRAELDVPDEHVIAVDARGEPEEVRAVLASFADTERQRRVELWAQTSTEASSALEVFADVEFAALAREWDLRLWWVWDAAVARRAEQLGQLDEFLELGGLMGVSASIRATVREDHHWSHLRAAIRRRGTYGQLSLAASGAAQSDTILKLPEFNGLRETIRFAAGVLKTASSERLMRHMTFRMGQFMNAVVNHSNLARPRWRDALEAYFESSGSDELWRWCEARWGKGPGYVADIAVRFEQESERIKIVPADLPDIRTLYAALPIRPPLFALRRIELQNFRSIEHRALALARDVNVLVGDNGLGKTTWLEAIAAGVGALLPAMDTTEPAPELADDDIRQVKKLVDDILDPQPQLPLCIELSVILQGHELEWTRHRRAMTQPVETEGEGMRAIAQQIAEEVRQHSERQLPVLAYYGTQRLWPTELQPEGGELGNRLEGYEACLDPASTHAHVLKYFRHYTMAGLQRNKPYAQVQAIAKAVVDCVEGAVDFTYDLQRQDFVLAMGDGDIQLFRQLSDGYRNIVAMVADIAWRAVRLNPQLGARAPALAEGIVLIDEIDLHLHPRWQRRVLADLTRAFPRLQFVTTTHSPFIIQSLTAGQLVNLDPDAEPYDYAHASPEDITEHVMGVELPQRSHRRQREAEVAARYYELLERVPSADPAELAALERELDEVTAPYADNQAFVAQLRRDYLSKKVERAP